MPPWLKVNGFIVENSLLLVLFVQYFFLHCSMNFTMVLNLAEHSAGKSPAESDGVPFTCCREGSLTKKLPADKAGSPPGICTFVFLVLEDSEPDTFLP